MKFSIVMAYHNRKQLLINTLKSICFSSVDRKDFELVIIDDGSEPEHQLKELHTLFPQFNMTILCLDKTHKTWKNSCIPYNIGFKHAKGDIVIIQNPECIHFGDVLYTIEQKIKQNTYLTFTCYSVNENQTKTISELSSDYNYIHKIQRIINPLINRHIQVDGENGWYNHKTVRPTYYHFTSAITKIDLDDLGGFDERYAGAVGYDDNEFLLRIKRKGMEVNIIESPIVLHQWHHEAQDTAFKTGKGTEYILNKARSMEPNKRLFEQVTSKETTYKATILNEQK